MQRTSTSFEDDFNSNIIDTDEFLRDCGYGDLCGDDVMRSAYSSGPAAVHPADFDFQPQYRSIALAEPQYRSHFEAPKPVEWAPPRAWDMPLKMDLSVPLDVDLAALQLPSKRETQPTPHTTVHTTVKNVASAGSGRRAPAFSTRGTVLLSPHISDVDIDYESLLAAIHDFQKNQELIQFRLDEAKGYVEGKWYSERHIAEVEFTINIYHCVNTEHKLEFVRRRGSTFAFHEFLMEARRVISGVPPLPMGLAMPGQIGGFNFDLVDTDEEMLNEWTQCLKHGILEAGHAILPIIAKAAGQAENSMRMCRSQPLVEQLFAKAISADSTCSRYSIMALSRLVDAGLVLPAHQLKLVRSGMKL